MVTFDINGKHIYLNGFLHSKLENAKKMMKKKWDVIIIIDGKEGSGKSTLGFSVAWYISDGNLTLNNVCEGTDDAMKKLDKLPDGSTLIIDEGSLMFSSKDVMKKENKKFQAILQVIRQKCMCLVVVAPSIFDLSKYIAIDRSRFLLHVYTGKNLERGKFTYYGEKKKKLLYMIGKKNFNSYSKPRPDFIGNFTKFEPFGEAYQALKRKSLREAFGDGLKKKVPIEVEREIKKELLQKIIEKIPIKSRTALAEAVGMHRNTFYLWSNGGDLTNNPQMNTNY